MLIKDFIFAHWSDILVAIGFIALMVFLYYKGKKKALYGICEYLVIEAEKWLGSKTGQQKLNYVYQKLPTIIKMFMSKEKIIDIIEDTLVNLKDSLRKNQADLKGLAEESKPDGYIEFK